jgi:hypothetical protein
MKTRTMKVLAALFILMFAQSVSANSESFSVDSEKGFFSLGVRTGMGQFRLLNTDGSYNGYRTLNYGVDLDIQIWGSGAGQIRFFGSYLAGSGKDNSSGTINSNETSFGLKGYANEYIYLGASYGRGASNVKVHNVTGEVELSYQLTKITAGIEIPISESFRVGLETSYRIGIIRANENSSILENSSYDGSAACLQFIWSPPSTTVNLAK